MKRIYNWQGWMYGLLLLMGTACTDEIETSVGGLLREGEVALQWLGPNMGIQHVGTRSSDYKEPSETAINNVHVFIFKEDGNYLTTTEGSSDAFQGYRYQNRGYPDKAT